MESCFSKGVKTKSQRANETVKLQPDFNYCQAVAWGDDEGVDPSLKQLITAVLCV